jgi:hypothetical protein
MYIYNKLSSYSSLIFKK